MRELKRTVSPLAILILALCVLSVMGCPGGESAQSYKNGQRGRCESVGTRCRLRSGVLGVCDVKPTSQENVSARAELICTPQH